jgi:hypothetical protein
VLSENRMALPAVILVVDRLARCPHGIEPCVECIRSGGADAGFKHTEILRRFWERLFRLARGNPRAPCVYMFVGNDGSWLVGPLE